MMYALVDCNNFFVSCERVFNPKLQNRPVIVLSNNDGCAVARSNEVKKMGVEMGAPLFKIKDLVKKHNIAVLSSNFSLYGNLSSRIMNIIKSLFPDVEVYSVDEAFINLQGFESKEELCIELVKIIERYTGVPVSIGIAPTRTLAKVANHIAKKQNLTSRVFYFQDHKVLEQVLVGDIWGIGRQLQKRLHVMGVYTAGELAAISFSEVKKMFNIVVMRTVQELNGISCIKLQDQSVNKSQIMVSRSFGQRVTDLESMQEAIAEYASRACVTLRKQKLVTGSFHVFLHTGLYGLEVYRNSQHVKLPGATCDSRIIVSGAKDALQKMFRKGYRYQKVGIILTDLSRANVMQFDIFEHQNLKGSEKLMTTLDHINKTLGKGTLAFAATGIAQKWQMKSQTKSQNFTGDWDQLPVVKIKS